LQRYLIKTIEIIKQYKNNVYINLDKARNKIIEEDLEIIAKNRIHADEQKKIIDKEYDKFAFKAIKTKGNSIKQLKLLLNNSNEFNKEFTERVVRINNEYLKNTKNMNDFLDYLRNKMIKLINKNNKKNIILLNLLDEELVIERNRFENQYKSYLKTINQYKNCLEKNYDQEIKFLYDLNFQRDVEINTEIQEEENLVKHLPIAKLEIIEALEKQKQELFNSKHDELLKKLSEIEANKLSGKPVLVKEMEEIKQRLSDDYVKLYQEIQELENEFLEQYTLINEDYMENYQDYLNKQAANKLSIENEERLYQPFESLNSYHKDLISIFHLNQKEILQKSNDTRESIQNEKQKSKEKQDRIINA
jgi:hypothetical protein